MNKRFMVAVMAMVVTLALPTLAVAENMKNTLQAGNSCNGNYVDVTAKQKTVSISELGLHLSPGKHHLKIYQKAGSYVGSQTRPENWQLVSERHVVSQGPGVLTSVGIDLIEIQPLHTTGIMIVSSHTLFYSNRDSVEPTAENADLRIYSADSVCGEPFEGTQANRVWNGAVYYNEEFCFPLISQQQDILNLCI